MLSLLCQSIKSIYLQHFTWIFLKTSSSKLSPRRYFLLFVSFRNNFVNNFAIAMGSVKYRLVTCLHFVLRFSFGQVFKLLSLAFIWNNLNRNACGLDLHEFHQLLYILLPTYTKRLSFCLSVCIYVCILKQFIWWNFYW